MNQQTEKFVADLLNYSHNDIVLLAKYHKIDINKPMNNVLQLIAEAHAETALFAEFPSHRERVLKKFGLDRNKHYSLNELAKKSGYSKNTLQKVYNRGIGAYRTNPNSVRIKGSFKKGPAPMSLKLSKEQWAFARVYSFIDKNPKHDNDLRH